MKLIVGLGNPGLRYRNTRHNAGYMVLNNLTKKYGLRIKKRIFKALLGEGRIDGNSVFLLLPQTFMNLSGESVALVRNKVDKLSDILVVYDDIDLKLGNIRFRSKGSSGGHKGLRSIIEALGTEDFPRLRIGIRPEDNKIGDTADFVLRPFLKKEKNIFIETIDKAVEGIETWISSGIEICMTKYNRKDEV